MGPDHMCLNPNQKHTELKKCLHMEDTVITEYQHTEDTVNTEYQRSEDTVNCQHMEDTVITRSLNPKNLWLNPNPKNPNLTEDTVNTEYQHTEDTVNTEYQHTEDTVNMEFQRTENTVNRQHMVDTVITRSLNLKNLWVVLIFVHSITILCVDLMGKLMLMTVLLLYGNVIMALLILKLFILVNVVLVTMDMANTRRDHMGYTTIIFMADTIKLVMEIQRMDLRRHMEATNPKIPTLVLIPKIYDPMKMSTLRNDILFDLSMT